MSCRDTRALLSALLDRELGESGRLDEHLRDCAACREELAGLEAASRLLAVVEPTPDPGFLVRFRARRDAQAQASPWKWLAVRLAPVAGAVSLAAVATVWIGAQANGELRELEAQALQSGLAAVTTEAEMADRVLGIALEPPAAEPGE